jgi:hypothetical protein
MKYYFKIFLLSLGITLFNILIYQIISSIKISLYNSAEAFIIYLMVAGFPIQFVVLTVVSLISKKNKKAIMVTAGLFVGFWLWFHWKASIRERRSYDIDVEEKQLYSKIEQKDYDTGVSTPEGYPIKLMTDGDRFTVIIDGKGYYAGKFDNYEVVSESWGNGSTEGYGEAIPDSLKLFWYSFVENKYYGLNTKLDKAKISNYFKNGYKKIASDKTGKVSLATQGDYEDLIAGIAPGGDVVLWISGTKDTREIGIYKAKEMNRNKFKSYDIVEEDEIKRVLSENNIQSNGIVHINNNNNNNKPIPFGIWTEKYREKFNWKVDINNLGQTKSELMFYFYNGENFSLYNEEAEKTKYEEQFVPNYIIFNFAKNKKEYRADFEFDEDEIFNHFKKITKENPNEPIDIVLDINPNFTKATIQLKSKNRTLDFLKMKTLEVSVD